MIKSFTPDWTIQSFDKAFILGATATGFTIVRWLIARFDNAAISDKQKRSEWFERTFRPWRLRCRFIILFSFFSSRKVKITSFRFLKMIENSVFSRLTAKLNIFILSECRHSSLQSPMDLNYTTGLNSIVLCHAKYRQIDPRNVENSRHYRNRWNKTTQRPFRSPVCKKLIHGHAIETHMWIIRWDLRFKSFLSQQDYLYDENWGYEERAPEVCWWSRRFGASLKYFEAESVIVIME